MKTPKAQKDWHPADVVAALRKRNTSLRQLAKQHQYSHIHRVLKRPWLAAEHIVATALGMKPEEIWPTRYADPEKRQRAFRLTRKIKLPLPPKPPAPKAAAPSRGKSSRETGTRLTLREHAGLHDVPIAGMRTRAGREGEGK